MSAESQLNPSEGNVAGKGGKGGIGGKGGKGGKGGIEGKAGKGGKRSKGDRRDFPERHQSFVGTLTWCPAVYVAESVCPSP